MFAALKNLLSSQKSTASELSAPDSKLAAAALMVHLTAIDGIVTEEEQQQLSYVLKSQYELEESEVEELIESARQKDAEAVDFYQFTSILKKQDEQERIEIIRMMWELVYADGENNELEDNMVWRVAELLGVSSRDRTILRKEIKAQKGL